MRRRFLSFRLSWSLIGLALLLSPFVSLRAVEKEPLEVYRARRAELMDRLKSGVIVLFGLKESEAQTDYNKFRQEDNFYYLTGWNEPDAILLLLPQGRQDLAKALFPSQQSVKEILFIPQHDYAREKWTGPKLGPTDKGAADAIGVQMVLAMELFSSEVTRALNQTSILYTLLPRSPYSREQEKLDKLKALAPFAEFRDVAPSLASLRQIKSKTELALLQKAIDLSMEAHREAMKAMRPGMFEYEIQSLMEYTFKKGGAERPAYAPIVGSGFNSTTLHYNANTNPMKEGEVVVIDVAAEYAGYAADVTRTLPVNGKFTPRQREIYQIVLDAQKAAMAQCKRGATIGRNGAIHRAAFDYINTHGKDAKGEPLGKYFIHGTSHWLGLNVHDVGDVNRGLEPGMIFTIEPGIYLPEENLGVRIEDDILVTENGCVNLTERLPREVDEIEKFMAQAKAAAKK